MSRLHRFAILSAVAALAVAAAAPPAVAQVTKPSEITYPPLPAFQAPKPTRFVLPNGMVVMVIEDHELPLVNVTARIRTGSLLEPAEKAGLAGLVGTVLRSGGTTTRKPDALDEFLEARAASIESGMSADSASASMSALKADVPAIMEAFADVLRNPAFDPDRLKIALTAVTAGIARQNDNPQGITQREFTKTIQGADSPFGRTTTYASIGAVTRDDLLAWHKKYFHPNRMIVGVVGDITVDEARALVTKAFGDWPKGPAVADTWPAPRTTPQPGVFEAVKADSTQSFVAVGHQGELLRTSPDYVPVTVMNEVLAGGFTSRLFGKIRTELGLAYSVGGSVNSNWTRVAPFQMQMSTRADATVKAIEALIAEAKLLATTKPATDAELKLAKDSILNSFVFNNDEPSEVLGQQLAFEYYGQPLDWLDRYRAAVEKVTAADVARVAAKYIHPDRLSIVVVGPSEGRDKPLSALGTVKTLDITIPPPPALRARWRGRFGGQGRHSSGRFRRSDGGRRTLRRRQGEGPGPARQGGRWPRWGGRARRRQELRRQRPDDGEDAAGRVHAADQGDAGAAGSLPAGHDLADGADDGGDRRPRGVHGHAAGRAGDAGVDAPAGRGAARARAAAAAPAAHAARLRSRGGR